METNKNDQKQKKGFLAAIWESMTKTGGCCGSGENCCGSSQQDNGKEKTRIKMIIPKQDVLSEEQ